MQIAGVDHRDLTWMPAVPAGLGPRTSPGKPCPGPRQPAGQAGSPRAAAGDPVTCAHVRCLWHLGRCFPAGAPGQARLLCAQTCG
jgi:hypothetical protein